MSIKNPLRLTSLNLVTLLLHIHPTVATSGLRNDISAFVPACAIDCVFSFLNVNYDTETLNCGDTALDSICATSSLSGFTLGEGVMQCMTAEKSVDSCSEEEASDSSIREAYKICDGRPNAIEATHGVVTATLLIDPDTGKLVFPKPTKIPNKIPETSPACSISSIPLTSSTSTESTTTTSTSTASNTLPTTLITAPSKSESLPSKSSTSSTEPPAEATETSAPAAAFSSGQLAGISLGAICAAAGVVLGIVFLTRYCLRRRRRHNSKKGPISHRDTWGYGFDKRSHSAENSFTGSHLHRYTGPYPSHILPGQGYNRKSWRPSAIGFAISPSRQGDQATTPTRTPTRPISRLLPAKPDLPPVPPKDGSPPPIVVRQATMSPQLQAEPSVPFIQQVMANPAQSGSGKPQPPRLVIPELYDTPQGIAELPAHNDHAVRESTLTEFEEDGHRSTSPVATIWPTPSADATSASDAYHATGSNENWTTSIAKRRSVSENDVSTPLSAEPKIATAQSALVATAIKTDIPSKSTTTPKLPPEPKTPNLQNTSSQPKTPKTMPSPLFSRHPNPRSSSQPLPSNNSCPPKTTTTAAAANLAPNRPARSRATSTDSGITCISTSSETSEDMIPPAPQPAYNLSPVAESPQSRTGDANANANANTDIIQDHSPVSYPSIPPDRRDTQSTRGHERPFSGRGGRTLIPPPRRPIQYHNYISTQPIPTTNRPRYPPDINTPSYPPTMRIVSPSDDRAILPSARRKRPPSHLPHPFPMHPQPRPTRGRGRGQGQARGGYHPHPHPHPHPHRQPAYHPMPIPQPYKTTTTHQDDQHQVHNHWLPPRPLSRPQSQNTTSRADSPSLLAKRLGTERAANMAMPVMQPGSTQGQWRQTPPMSQQQQMMPACPVTPDLPSTPTWLPRLTPTRRGDDLFLNVG